MKADEIEKLIEKYKEGITTLDEEKVLFDYTDNSQNSLETWFSFVKNNKVEKPKHFNDKMWESFQSKKNRKRKLFLGAISAAASIILLIGFIIASPKQNELSYSQKEALLNQALDMVSSSELIEEVQHHIIYENDMIVIYKITK